MYSDDQELEGGTGKERNEGLRAMGMGTWRKV
jgi:hypothetical protein